MNTDQEYYRSHRRLPFIGFEGQEALRRARVLVVGAGGLGCPCLTALTGAGTGTLGIADGDTVSVSNLHRQSLFAVKDVGEAKTTAAARRLQDLNPQLNILVHPGWVDEDTVEELLAGYDLVADCTDNFTTRYLLNDACVRRSKPLVYGAIHRAEGHLSVFNYQDGPTLRCLFPAAEQGIAMSCADAGAYNISTAVVGTLMANEIIKIITGHPEVLSGRLLQLNLLEGSSRQIAFSRTASGLAASLNRTETTRNSLTPLSAAARLSAPPAPLLIDVRTREERSAGHIGGLHIPLPALLAQCSYPFPADTELLLYCQRGQRSRLAARHLRQQGFTRVYELTGGYEAWMQQFSKNA